MSKERWLTVLNREQPDHVPVDYWATGEANQKLMRHLSCENMDQVFKQLHIDCVISIEPQYIGPLPKPGEDIFGCRYQNADYGTDTYSEYTCHLLALFQSVEEIEDNYTWVSPDWYDCTNIADQITGWEDCPIRGGRSEPFLMYKNLRGQEPAFIDLIEYPEIVNHCLVKLFDLAYQNTLRLYEQIPGKVMLSYVAEDLGGQESLMFSLDHIREFLLPRMKRIIDLAHSAGVCVFHHNDGAIRDVIPDMIDLGIDILNPIQWVCKGMDREGLKDAFGKDIICHGGVDNQYT